MNARSAFGREQDFEASLRFLTPEEGGRRQPPRNGYRADLRYPGYPSDQSVWMVWPLEFFTAEGDLAESAVAPQEVHARFWVLDSELRESVHQPRLRPGVEIEILEGGRLVARGVVTRLVSLNPSY